MNEHDTLPPGGMGRLDPTDIRDPEPDRTNLRCPDWDQGPLPIGEEPLGGCGSTNILWDGEVWDCFDCGLFFTTEAGTPPREHPACAHYRHWARPEAECPPHCDGHYDWETCDDCGRRVCFDIDCPNGWRWVDGMNVSCYLHPEP